MRHTHTYAHTKLPEKSHTCKHASFRTSPSFYDVFGHEEKEKSIRLSQNIGPFKWYDVLAKIRCRRYLSSCVVCTRHVVRITIENRKHRQHLPLCVYCSSLKLTFTQFLSSTVGLDRLHQKKNWCYTFASAFFTSRCRQSKLLHRCVVRTHFRNAQMMRFADCGSVQLARSSDAGQSLVICFVLFS